jgi:hypothetical protein
MFGGRGRAESSSCICYYLRSYIWVSWCKEREGRTLCTYIRLTSAGSISFP